MFPYLLHPIAIQMNFVCGEHVRVALQRLNKRRIIGIGKEQNIQWITKTIQITMMGIVNVLQKIISNFGVQNILGIVNKLALQLLTDSRRRLFNLIENLGNLFTINF